MNRDGDELRDKVMDVMEYTQLRDLALELIDAITEHIFWLEVECEHPRNDPHPAMINQIIQLRSVLNA
jgi:hypothetical protein